MWYIDIHAGKSPIHIKWNDGNNIHAHITHIIHVYKNTNLSKALYNAVHCFYQEIPRSLLVFSSYQSREIIAQWGEKRNHKDCVTAEVFKVAQRVNTQSASSPLPVTEGLQSGCPFLLVPSSYSSTAGWNEIPEKFMPHVIFVPLAVDHGSAVCTSNQSHRLCVTLGEVGTRVQTAESPSPRSQNNCGHGPSFIIVSVSSAMKTKVTNHTSF